MWSQATRRQCSHISSAGQSASTPYAMRASSGHAVAPSDTYAAKAWAFRPIAAAAKAANPVTSEQREVLFHRVQVQTTSDVHVAEATAVEAKPPLNMLMVFLFVEGVSSKSFH